ncbi:hypothetical protein OKW21_003619 [Catalinimonas alkaloidigena]|uniref:hypothetical protein n=1 Tax=Catalinimonas alkaloidigena TaxID=1075417 RepID=UPI0024070F64|nr:hypothetical protein [Catalinimonas alkaloidigena]MDF9798356.1 hypothetical protein [Catalinimonas alkaloidigena]
MSFLEDEEAGQLYYPLLLARVIRSHAITKYYTIILGILFGCGKECMIENKK